VRPVAQRLYVRLRPLAYVTGRGPRGGIESPLGRGAEAYRMGSGHVSAPDPSLVLDQGLSFSCLGILGPCRGRSGPHIGGSRLHPTDLAYTRGGPGPPWGSRLHTQRSGALPWGSGLTVGVLEHSFFPRHVVAPDPPMWCGRALLWALSSGPWLDRVVAWPRWGHYCCAAKR
jgi:hypothetical protein